MRWKLIVASVFVAVLGVTACGSSSKSGSTSTAAAIPSRTYRVKLTGAAETPKGAPKGSGSAVVTLKGKTLQACWRFSRLNGFTHPTFAHIHKGVKGTSGTIVVPLSTGTTFKAKGCVSTPKATILAIEKNPHGYYVNIHSPKYPGGAVRAQL